MVKVRDRFSSPGDVRLKVRPANLSDREFILDLVPRFLEFGLPAWRDQERMAVKTRSTIEAAFRSPPTDTQLLVAETEDGMRLGFIHLQTSSDYFTGEPYGYVSELAVSADGEGQGAGKALMQAGEAWARAKGYSVLILDVFTNNERACRFYERLGYREEIRKYVKLMIDPD